MRTKILSYVLMSAGVFYQLDYRQRFEAEVSVPGLSGIAVKKSFETRYRPQTEVSKLETKAKPLRDPTAFSSLHSSR